MNSPKMSMVEMIELVNYLWANSMTVKYSEIKWALSGASGTEVNHSAAGEQLQM